MTNPEVPEDKRTCAKCGSPVGRGRDGRPGRTEGFCPKCGQEFSFTPKLQAGRPGRGAVRGRGLPRPRRPRLDLPRPRQERLRPLGRAQGPAQLRRPRRARRRDRRAAVPGPGRAPADRRDLQLRHARRRRLHRHGVRRRHLAQADPQGADAGQQRGVRPAAGRPGARLHPRDPAGVPVPPRPRPRLLRLQARQPHPGRRRGQADRPRRRAPRRRRGLGDLRHGRLPGARGGRGRAERRLRHLHDRPHPGGAVHGVPRLPGAPTSSRCPTAGQHAAVPRARLALLAGRQVLRARPGRPVRVGRRAARRRCSACCARSWREKRAGTALTSASSVLFETPAVSTVGAGLVAAARPARRRDRPAARLADQHRRRPTPAQRLARPAAGAGGDRRGAARAGAGRARGERARQGARDQRRSCCEADPWEWRALWIDGLAALQQRRLGRRRRRRSTRSTSRCPASWRPSWRSPWPARTAASPTSPRASTATCARDRRGLRRPRGVRHGPDPRRDAGDTDGAVAALDLVPPTSRGYGEPRSCAPRCCCAASRRRPGRAGPGA